MQTVEAVCQGREKCVSRIHMCRLTENGRDREWLESIVRDATHFCLNCGRSANDPRYLCKPVMIG